MSEVTVKAVQPVLGLEDGAVVTIEKTRRVAAAIEQGRLVEYLPEVPEVFPDLLPGEYQSTPEPDPTVPNRNAAKSVWSAFLREHGIEHDYDAHTRDQLAAFWDQHAESHLAEPED